MKIGVIGAGQLGSRHLQALAALPGQLSLYVIDPSAPNLDVAKDRLESAVAQSLRTAPYECSFSAAYNALPAELDLCIVATGAAVRRQAIESLLAHCKVRFLLLEKILFPRVGDYAAVSELLSTAGCEAWVNCNMRMIPFLRDLKEMCGPGPVHYGVAGSRIRLASNLIHHIDFTNYLTGSENFSVDLSLMDKHLGSSKREGYADWEGTCVVKFDDGSVHTHTSYESGALPIMLSIYSDQLRFILRSGEQLSWISTARDGWSWKQYDTVFPMQSTMTTEVATALFETGDCPLPRYELSAKMHVTMIDAYRRELQQLNLIQDDFVPFT